MKAKLTDWFPAHIKPVRVGMYECKACREQHYWTGKDWFYDRQSFDPLETVEWRGLASKPRGGK